MTRQLTAIIEREDDDYVALCPQLDIASQGATASEARANLKEALELFFESASAAETRPLHASSHSDMPPAEPQRRAHPRRLSLCKPPSRPAQRAPNQQRLIAFNPENPFAPGSAMAIAATAAMTFHLC